MQSKARYEIVLETKPKTIVLQEEIKKPILKEVIDEETGEPVLDDMGEKVMEETGEYEIVQPEVTEELEEIISVQYAETEEIREKLAFEEVQKVKAECNAHILARYSLTDQSNMVQQGLFITATAQAEKRDLSLEELKKLGEIKAARTWIEERVQKCREDVAAIYAKYNIT